MKEKKLKAMKAVYTYFFPEVRELIRLPSTLSERMFLTSTPIDEAQSIVDTLGFKKTLQVPQTLEGKVDLDAIHEPVIDRVVRSYETTIPGLAQFRSRYPTSGSSEGIFHVLAELKAKGTDQIYVFQGEYEGYKEYGKALGIETIDVDPRAPAEKLDPGVWFISNPSARDGNIIPNEKIMDLCNKGHKVMLDLAYVGSTRQHQFDVNHENIPAAFLSFSKPYGIFRFRMGFTFSRKPIDSLYANKWFKDVERLIAAAKIAEDIGPNGLHQKYQPIQEKIIASINSQHGLIMRPSDALLLGYMTDEDTALLGTAQQQLIAPYKRGNGYRFCLTPYYEEVENEIHRSA